MTPPTRVLLASMPDEFLGFHVAARLPNLGLVSMAGNRNPNESEIGVVDLVLCRENLYPWLKHILNKFQPEIIGLNSMTFQYFTARRISQWIKENYDPNVKIVMGGYHPTLNYEEITDTSPLPATANELTVKKRNPWCDYIIRGEGEVALRNFVHAYRTGESLASINGLSWKGPDGKFRHNQAQQILNLAEIKLPDRSVRSIKTGYHMIGRPGDVIETSRGCTNLCKFCSIAHMYGRTCRCYDLDRVITDIKTCREMGSNTILFIDDNITMYPERFEKLLDKIIAEGLNDMIYHTQASAAGLLARKDIVPKMGKAGFSVVFFGIENIKPSNLDFFKKSIPIKRLKELVQGLNTNNMISFGGFILGNPGDKLSDFDLNVKFARLLDLDVPAFELMTPYPKTEIRTEMIADGWVTNPDDYSRYNGIYANVKTKYMTPAELEMEVLRCYYHYYTPTYLFSRLRRLGILKRYTRFIMQIFKKYSKLAFSSWLKTFTAKVSGKDSRQAENGVVNQFQGMANHFREEFWDYK